MSIKKRLSTLMMMVFCFGAWNWTEAKAVKVLCACTANVGATCKCGTGQGSTALEVTSDPRGNADELSNGSVKISHGRKGHTQRVEINCTGGNDYELWGWKCDGRERGGKGSSVQNHFLVSEYCTLTSVTCHNGKTGSMAR